MRFSLRRKTALLIVLIAIILSGTSIAVSGNIIKGNSYIGAGSILKENNVIDNSVIGNNCYVNYSVISHSKIGNNCIITPFCNIDHATIADNSTINPSA